MSVLRAHAPSLATTAAVLLLTFYNLAPDKKASRPIRKHNCKPIYISPIPTHGSTLRVTIHAP